MTIIEDLSEDEKTCLVAAIDNGYYFGKFEEGACAQISQLLGYEFELNETTYSDLLKLYLQLGGGVAIQNHTNFEFSSEEYQYMIKLHSRKKIESFLRHRHYDELAVYCGPFNTYIIEG